MDGRTRTELAPRAGCPVGAALRERARGGRHGADPGAAGVWASLKPRERKNVKGKRWPGMGFTLWTGNTKMKTRTGDYRKGGLVFQNPEMSTRLRSSSALTFPSGLRRSPRDAASATTEEATGRTEARGGGRAGPAAAVSPPGPTWGPREPVGQACGHVRTAQPSSPDASRVRGHEHASSDPHSHPCRAPPSPDSALGVGTQGCPPSATVVALLVTGEDEIWTTEVRSRRPA